MAVAPTPASAPPTYKLQSTDPLGAYQWTGADTMVDAPTWVQARSHVSSNVLHVVTRLGTLAAFPGDWVYPEPDGQLAVMDNALFHATFEPVKEPDPAAPDFVPIIPPREALVRTGGVAEPAAAPQRASARATA